jgi:phosphotriesterase-related protein
MPTVETVRGRVSSDELGTVFMHEHIFLVDREVRDEYPALVWRDDRDERIELARQALRELKERGVDTLVDCTAPGLGRHIPDVVAVNQGVDLNIVVSTGYYTFADLPRSLKLYPRSERTREDVLTELFIGDVRDGIGDSGVRAGALKCCTDAPGVTPDVERILRAIAWAHRETGVFITTHTLAANRSGLDQQRILAEEGVDLTRVVIGHTGDTTDLDYIRALLDRGSTIGSDRFGFYLDTNATLEERVRVVAELCSLGYTDRIILSHDYSAHVDARRPGTFFDGFPHWRYTHLLDDVLPALREAGVTEEQLDQMLVANPRRLLTPGQPY